MGMVIDLGTVFKVLTVLRDMNGSAKMFELQQATGLGWGTLGKYIEYMKAKGLISEERRGKARVIKLTKRGEDYIFLFSRLLSLLAEI